MESNAEILEVIAIKVALLRGQVMWHDIASNAEILEAISIKEAVQLALDRAVWNV